MEKWEDFKVVLKQWATVQITDEEFLRYITDSEFECAADRRLADIFIKQHDSGQWTASYFHY